MLRNYEFDTAWLGVIIILGLTFAVCMALMFYSCNWGPRMFDGECTEHLRWLQVYVNRAP